MWHNNIFSNKKVLITGNTGFKGSWLSIWLDLLGAKIYGLALDPPTMPSLFEKAKLNEVTESNHMLYEHWRNYIIWDKYFLSTIFGVDYFCFSVTIYSIHVNYIY